jgi:hypothetical protein
MRTLDPSIGNEITCTIKTAIADAKSNGDECQFDFNGVTVVVSGASDPELIHRDWSRGLSGYLGENPTIGPYPKPQLSEAEKESDAKIEAENEERRRIQNEKYEQKQREKELVLQGALGNAGPIELSDAEGWQKCVDANKDGYGSYCVRYAEKWARLMQVRIASGETIAECAEELSRLADDEGITGFMYGAAVSMLSQCWKHGEGLRRWHNKETQIGTEGDEANESGGVLNPALLNIG